MNQSRSNPRQALAALSLGLPFGFAVVIALYAAVLIRWPDNFFADDSYFYFQVAWNAARGFGSTFNQVMPTNGYHPLWMLVCIAVFKILPVKTAALHGIGVVISLLNAGTCLLLTRLLARVTPGFWWAAFLLYVPFCFLSQLGTEGALSGFFLTALAVSIYEMCIAPSMRQRFIFALCGSLAVLSRLDNIFIVALVFFAALLLPSALLPATLHPVLRPSAFRRALFLFLPVSLLLWGGYIASNLHWFGTIQPISGMLKAHSHGEHKLLSSLPHIAMVSLALVIVGTLMLARYRRDLFFRVVELPFAIGILIHASYIEFVMSSETRWTWYYTSWVLLASILLARTLSLAFAARPPLLRKVLAAGALATLFVAWIFLAQRRFGHLIGENIGEDFQTNMSDRLHLHTVIAFDKPGRMAFFSDVHVVALDGLMGDLAFQNELASTGIAHFDSEHQVDAFVGPPQPLDEGAKEHLCDRIFLSTVQFHCSPAGPTRWIVDRVEVFARLSGKSAGILPLPESNLIWNTRNNVAVWRLPSSSASPSSNQSSQGGK